MKKRESTEVRIDLKEKKYKTRLMLMARCSGIVHLKILSLTQTSLRADLHQERFGTSLSFPAGTYEAFSNTS